jgi:uncharacterized phiE125 gp8 family phage protein
MTVTTLAPPAAEPVPLADAKAYLRIGHDGEDGMVAGLIASARARIEGLTGLAMINRTLRMTLDRWTSGTVETRRVALPMRPAGELVAVRVRDAAGVAETVTERFAIEPGQGGRLVWMSGGFPWPRQAAQGIEIEYVAGFGAGPGDVPDGLALAVKRLAAHAYHARDPGRLNERLPEDVAGLLSPWRRIRL